MNVNSGATVNVTSDSTARDGLVTIGGNLIVNEGGVFNVKGQNMGLFSGSLMNITSGGKIDVTGGAVELSADGSGILYLLNVSSSTINVDNPKSFILDASQNTNARLINNSTLTLNDIKSVNGTQTSGPLSKLVLKVTANNIGTINAPTEASAATDIIGKTSADEQQVVGWLSGLNLTGKKLEFVSAGPFINVNSVNVSSDKKHVTGHVSSTTSDADPNLTEQMKTTAKQNVLSAYNEAVSNVNHAQTSTDVVNAKNVGVQNIVAALTDAQNAAHTLQTDKTSALKDLSEAQTNANQTIDVTIV
ncbi:DUF1542 domain-containing protein [Bombilactobacillus folatiphilus]|uniref:DUF1542 domain-containing protein n=1 Tax=Bombilactobacillus folatiphilus TaxID=2923362 RepID=A0ABY4PB03_9LACO|nr:DUF1542 domain-containing protein [Bombilactobacillus folatiphilus]UQS82734.1 DUF1542 domain-containing protein [Bombilactobacillus folatiphilus]